MPYPDIAQWVSTPRMSCGRNSKLGQWLMQPRKSFREDFIYIFTCYLHKDVNAYILPLGREVTFHTHPTKASPMIIIYSLHSLRLSDVVHVQRLCSIQTGLYMQRLQNVYTFYMVLDLQLQVIWLCSA
jgi:hypothetical protein